MQVRRSALIHIRLPNAVANSHLHTRTSVRSGCSAGILANVLDSARETLVLLGIVVLETDLELNGFQESTLLLQRGLQDGGDALNERIAGNFRPVI